MSSEVKKRILTSLVLLPIITIVILQGGLIYFALIFLLAILMCYEWMLMFKVNRVAVSTAVLLLLLSILILSTYLLDIGFLCVVLVSCLFLGIIYCILCGERLTVIIGAYFYIGFPIMALIILRSVEISGVLILYLFLSVALIDMFAMLFGKKIGGAKLAPVISPNKTWAGLGGAIFAGVFTSLILAYIVTDKSFGIFIKFGMWGIALGIVAQLGDLFESYIKRCLKVKDSGTILPGHGGILDRVDGLIFVLVLVLILYLFKVDFLMEFI